MTSKSRRIIWIVLAAFLICALAMGQLWQKSRNPLPALEPSASSSPMLSTVKNQDEALPTPAHPFLKQPIFKKSVPDNGTTIVPETPQANSLNGTPKIMKTVLGLEVSPLCFEQLFGIDGPKGPIDVSTCEKASGYKNIKTGFESGRFRSIYEFPSEPDMPAEKGFSSYELLGDVAGGTAIETYNETGGTGRFSSLILVKLTGNTLALLDQVAGGDRCNSGLTDAKVENGKLIYSISVTPGDLPALAWGDDKGLKAFEDLEASAMSCFATATFTDHQLSKITLNSEAAKEKSDWASQYKYQACFNQKFRGAIEQGRKDMTVDQFKAFMDDFRAGCIKK